VTTSPPAPRNPLSTRPFHVLFVCTANQARSPMAEVIARATLDRLGVDGWVTSAGFHEGGRPATTDARAVMEGRGLDLSRHVSRKVTPEMIAGADVVVTMTVDHTLQLAAMVPGCQAWTMPLRELTRAATSGPMSVDEVHDWVRATAGRRRPETLLSREDLDVVDPAGRGRTAFERTAAELGADIGRVLGRWFAQGPARERGWGP
jgi:protein-tyrosine-phosphatase